MQCLRALILAGLLFISSSALAESAEITLTTQATSTQGSVSVTLPQSQRRDGFEQSLKILSSRLKPGFRLSAQVYQSKVDYSQYRIQDQNGREKPLSSEFDSYEQDGEVGVEFAKSWLSFNTSHRRSLSESPFHHNLTTLSPSAILNSGLTRVVSSYSFGSMDQPLSFYTDPISGRRKSRATSLDSNTASLAVDQVLNSKSRAFFQFESNSKTERPRLYGITARTAYAITGKDILKLEAARFFENRNENLSDERGYFDLTSGELLYTRYLTYDLTTSVGYGLIVEQEDNPQVQRIDQVATDVYTVAFDYTGDSWNAGVKYQQQVSNIEYTASLLGGRFSWVF